MARFLLASPRMAPGPAERRKPRVMDRPRIRGLPIDQANARFDNLIAPHRTPGRCGAASNPLRPFFTRPPEALYLEFRFPALRPTALGRRRPSPPFASRRPGASSTYSAPFRHPHIGKCSRTALRPGSPKARRPCRAHPANRAWPPVFAGAESPAPHRPTRIVAAVRCSDRAT